MNSASSAADHVQRHPLETLGRVGYAVKGAVYVLLGWIAFDAARGGGKPEGKDGALAAIAATDYGGILLWGVALGLASYALWRFIVAATDPENEGDDAKGLAKRGFYVLSGISYAVLAYSAYRTVSGAGSGGGDSTGEKTQEMLGLPGGRWIVAALALCIVGYGIQQFRRAYEASFMDKIEHRGLAQEHRGLIRRIGQGGLGARGVVYLIIGGFLGLAAYQFDPSEARGLDGALATLQEQPFGPYLLGAVALGLALYGVYCWVNAAYRRFAGNQ